MGPVHSWEVRQLQTCLLAKRRVQGWGGRGGARGGAGGYLCFNLTIHLIKKSLYPSFVLCLMIEFLFDKAPGGFEFGPLAKGA